MSVIGLTEQATRLRQTILADAPTLGPDSRFRFRCRPGIACFTQCCADVNIFLTPYDVLRMKNRLGLSSGEFLACYTVSPFTREQKLPVVALKMRENPARTCPFVDENGCQIYEDRPWSCRMYPVGKASKADAEFYFVLEEDGCLGFGEDAEWTIAGWMADQGVGDYDQMGDLFSAIITHPRVQDGPPLSPQQMEMFFIACYDLDRFRRFLFESRFFQLHDVAAETVERLRTDDLELLKFGFAWLRFWLFGDQTLKVREEVAEARRRQVGLARGAEQA